MKKFIKLITPRKFITILILVAISPLVYAANQTPQIKEASSALASIIFIEDNESNYDFSSRSKSTFLLKEIVIEAKFILKEKVKSGIVLSVDNNLFVIKIGDRLLNVETNATTTIFFGDGEKADVSDIDYDTKIYVFGYVKSDNTLMMASKIVIANKSRLHRL